MNAISDYGNGKNRGLADLAMKVPSAVKDWTIQAIGLDGSVLGTIPSEIKDGRLHFRAEVFGPAGVTMIYRITANQSSGSPPNTGTLR